jgi:hypothetical protein
VAQLIPNQFMAQKQKQEQLPHEQHQFTDREMHALAMLRPMMGGTDPEDEEVEEHLRRIEEHNAAKMHAAQTGGSQGLGPSEAEQVVGK